MEDDKIKGLFNDFQPELSSSFIFMAKLQKNMETVEILKRHNLALRKRNRVAVAIAAASGFIMGVILTMLFPLIGNWVSTITISMPRLGVSAISIDFSIILWIVTAGVCIITALNAYEIALAKLTPKSPIIK